jgi:hypothetical protein
MVYRVGGYQRCFSVGDREHALLRNDFWRVCKRIRLDLLPRGNYSPPGMWARVKSFFEVYGLIGGAVATTVAVMAAFSWLAVELSGKHVAAVVPVAVGAVLILGVPAAYLFGDRRRRILPTAADGASLAAAVAELEVANNYIKHVRDFMEGLRLSAVGLPSAQAIPKLRQLRELVMDAIIQGINSGVGEHIRCALFEPFTESGEVKLRVRSHRGHTHRVEHLTLRMTSVAGIAFTNLEPLYVPNAEADPRVETTTAGRPVKTLYCLPLYAFRATTQQDPVGVFSVASNHVDAFSESDRAFISACADMIGIVEFFIQLWEANPQPPSPPEVPPAPPAGALPSGGR